MNEFILEMVLGSLRSFLFKSSKAAKFAKYLLRIRDYILLLFPLDLYPQNQTEDPLLNAGVEVKPVAKADVKKAAKEFGFNLPFVKGR
jgi:hypothetical protein